MDLLILFFALIGGMILVVVLLARMHPGSGADLLDWDPTKRLERRYASEYEDMEEMLARHNRARAEEGLPPQTEDEYREETMRSDRRRERGEGR